MRDAYRCEERMMDKAEQAEPPLPADLAAALRAHGLPDAGETPLRQALEARLPSYSLFRLPPTAVRKWKVRYRLMAGDAYYDGQTVCEAYALALLAYLGERPQSCLTSP